MNRYLWAVLPCLTPLVMGCQAAEPERIESPSAFLEDVESRVVTSAVSGREYQISVALPLGYADSISKSYPVLFATDANGHFGTVVEVARMLRIGVRQIPQLLIVGLGYPSGGRQVHASGRGYDLSPTRDMLWEEDRGRESGGGPDFLRFIQEELFPLIDADYRTDPADRAIYGHSLGGLFALYAVLEGDGAFQRAIAASPSLWWDDRHLLALERDYSESHDSLRARVFLSMGLDEPDDVQEDSNCCEMVTNLRRLVDVWEGRGYEGLLWHAQFFEGENHQSVMPVGISRGLRFIYDPPL